MKLAEKCEQWSRRQACQRQSLRFFADQQIFVIFIHRSWGRLWQKFYMHIVTGAEDSFERLHNVTKCCFISHVLLHSNLSFFIGKLMMLLSRRDGLRGYFLLVQKFDKTGLSDTTCLELLLLTWHINTVTSCGVTVVHLVAFTKHFQRSTRWIPMPWSSSQKHDSWIRMTLEPCFGAIQQTDASLMTNQMFWVRYVVWLLQYLVDP